MNIQDVNINQKIIKNFILESKKAKSIDEVKEVFERLSKKAKGETLRILKQYYYQLIDDNF